MNDNSPIFGKTHRMPATVCPECDAKLDAAAGYNDDARPEPGDVTVCAWCTAILCFNQDLTLRATSIAERSEMRDAVLAVVRAVLRVGPPEKSK